MTTTTKKKRTAPVCEHCGGTGAGVEFPIFPLTKVPFGTICVPCDEQRHAEATV